MKKLLSSIALLVSLSAYPATYYIDYVGGNDASAGTSTGTAWQHAPGDPNASSTPLAARILGGDILYFKSGVTYILPIASGITVDSSHYANGVQFLAGSSNSWGTGRAIMDGGGDPGGCWGFFINGMHFMQFRGFEIANTIRPSLASDDMPALRFQNGCMSNIVADCYFHDIGTNSAQYGTCRKNGTDITGGGGWSMWSNNVVINSTQKDWETSGASNNIVCFNTFGIFTDHAIAINGNGNQIFGNRVTNNYPAVKDVWGAPVQGGYGIKIGTKTSDANTNLCYNNVIIGCPGGMFMEINGYLVMYENYFFNNTVVDWYQDSSPLGLLSWHCISNAPIVHSLFMNNLFVTGRYTNGFAPIGPRIQSGNIPDGSGTNYSLVGTNNIVAYNAYYDVSNNLALWGLLRPGLLGSQIATLTNFSDNGPTSPDYRFTNPIFGVGNSFNPTNQIFNVDPKVNGWPTDLRLAMGSPVATAGTNLSPYFTTDITGLTRTNWSIGAYEYNSSTIQLTVQPVSTRVQAGSNATFSVTVLGVPPITYQWTSNSVNIAGATNSTLTISSVQTSAHLSVYAVACADANGPVTSTNATLSVYIPTKLTMNSSGVWH